MKIILFSISNDLHEAWHKFFENIENVSIQLTDICQLSCDAIVSPANSFGFMDGGLDYLLSERFGWDLEKKVQKKIQELPERELLVGQSLLIETEDQKIPYLIVAPTMRIPTNFNIDTSIHAYLAMKAILIQALKNPQILTVAIPGLCTGIGRMLPEIAANQMFMAYEEVILNKIPNFENFGEAQKYHLKLNPNCMIWTH